MWSWDESPMDRKIELKLFLFDAEHARAELLEEFSDPSDAETADNS